MLKEFKKFALRGNMIDLAVGIIIGGAFNSLVTSLVDDIIMPFLGLILNRISFEDLFFSLDGETYKTLALAKASGAPTVNYGLFISGIINFIIMAFVMFMLVRWMNKLQGPAPEPLPTTKKCPECMSEVNIKARKCAYCLSELEVEEEKQELAVEV